MALNLTALLPNLYNIQKIFQEYSIKYGYKIYIDPEDDTDVGPKPSKSKNSSTMLYVADNILTYGTLKGGINGVRRAKKITASVYFIILIIILLAIVIVPIVFLIIEKTRIKIWCMLTNIFKLSIGTTRTKAFGFTRLVVLVIIFFMTFIMILYLTIKVFILNMKLYSKIYNFNHLETDQIQQVLNIFNPMKIKKDSIIISKGNSSYISNFVKKNTNIAVDWQEQDDICGEMPVFGAASTCKDSPTMLYPFIESHQKNPIDAFVLKKQIKSFDLYDQLATMQDAVMYFKRLMLKINDEVFSLAATTLTAAETKSLRDKICKVLLKDFTIVNDLHVAPANLSTNISNELDCFAQCMEDDTCIGASHNGQVCTILRAGDKPLEFNKNSVTPANTLLKAGQIIPITATSTSQVKFVSGSCSSNLAGCLASDADKTYAQLPSATSYTDVLNLGSGENKYVFNASTNVIISSKQANALFTCYVNMRQWYIDKISDIVLETDPTNTFNMDTKDTSYIAQVIKDATGNTFNSLSGALTDILADIPSSLLMKRREGSPNDKNSFIPYDRFIQKVGALDSKAFISEFVFNCEELRASSAGINNINQKYDIVSDDVKFYSGARDMVLAWLSIILTCGGIMLSLTFLDTAFAKAKDAENPDGTGNEQGPRKDQEQDEDQEQDPDRVGPERRTLVPELRAKDPGIEGSGAIGKKLGLVPGLGQAALRLSQIDLNEVSKDLDKINNLISSGSTIDTTMIGEFLKRFGLSTESVNNYIAIFTKIFPLIVFIVSNKDKITKLIDKKRMPKVNRLDFVTERNQEIEDFIVTIKKIVNKIIKDEKDEDTLNKLIKTLFNIGIEQSTNIEKPEMSPHVQHGEGNKFIEKYRSKMLIKNTEDQILTEVIIDIHGSDEDSEKKVSNSIQEVEQEKWTLKTINNLRAILIMQNPLYAALHGLTEDEIIKLFNVHFGEGKKQWKEGEKTGGVKEAGDILQNGGGGIKIPSLNPFKKKTNDPQLAILNDGHANNEGIEASAASTKSVKQDQEEVKIEKKADKEKIGTIGQPSLDDVPGRANELSDTQDTQVEANAQKELNALVSNGSLKPEKESPHTKVTDESEIEAPQEVTQSEGPATKKGCTDSVVTTTKIETKLLVDASLKIVLVVVGLMVFYFMFQSVMLKKSTNEEFNLRMMTANGQVIVHSSDSIVSMLYDDMVKNNNYGIRAPRTGKTATINNEIIDTDLPETDTNDAEPALMFEYIVAKSRISSTVPITISNSSSLSDIYIKLTEIVESYDKCNSIYSLANSAMPFPIVEITMYALVLVICIVAITMVIMKYKPAESISSVLLAKRATELPAPPRNPNPPDTQQCPPATPPTDAEIKATENQMLAIKICAILLILVIGGLFIGTLSQNTTSYASNLYANYGQHHKCSP